MAKDVGIRLTGDAAGLVKACDESVRSMQGISRIARTLTNEGADTATALKAIGEKGGPAFQELIAAGQAEGKTLQQLRQDVIALANEQAKAAKDAKAATVAEAQAQAVLSQRAAERAQAVSQAMGSMNSSVKGFVGGLMSAGAEMGALNRQMALAFGNPEAGKAAVEQIRELSKNTGLAEESLAGAARGMQKFGSYSDENLQRAAIASKKTGESIESISEAIGRYQKFGDARSQMQLKKMLGLDDKDIADAGGALEAMDKKFGTTTDGMVSNASKVKSELHELQQEIGVQTVKAMNDAVGAMLPFAKALHEMPDAIKGAIGQGATLFSGLTQIGSAALSVASQMKMAELSFSGMAAAAGPYAGIAALILGVAAAGEALILSTQVQTEKLDKETDAWEKQNDILRKNKDIRDAIRQGKPIDDPKAGQAVADAYGSQVDQVRKKIEDLGKARAEASKTSYNPDTNSNEGPDEAALERFDKQLAEQGQILQHKLNEQAAATKAAAKSRAEQSDGNADKKAAENGIAAWDNYKKRVANGFYETKEAQSAALDEVAKKVQHNGQKWTEEELKKHGIIGAEAGKILGSYEDIHLQQIRLTREIGKEKESASHKAAQETLRDGLHAIEMEDAQHKMSHQDKIARLNALLSKLGGDKEIRISIEKQIANEMKSANSEAERAREESARKIEEHAQKRLAAEQDIASKIKGLEGETTSDKVRELDKQIDAYRKAGVNEEEIAKYAKLKKQAIDREDTEKKVQAEEKVASAQAQVAKDRESDLKEQLAQGKDVQAQLTASINERYAREEDLIRARAAASSDANAQAEAEARISHLEHERVKEIGDAVKLRKEENRELDEKRKKLEAEKGFKQGGQSIQDAFGSGSTFGFSTDTSLLGATSTGTSGTAAGSVSPGAASPALAVPGGVSPVLSVAPGAAGGTSPSSMRAQKEASTIAGNDPAGTARIIELLSLIADRVKPVGASSGTGAGADASLGMSIARDSFFAKGK